MKTSEAYFFQTISTNYQADSIHSKIKVLFVEIKSRFQAMFGPIFFFAVSSPTKELNEKDFQADAQL